MKLLSIILTIIATQGAFADTQMYGVTDINLNSSAFKNTDLTKSLLRLGNEDGFKVPTNYSTEERWD